MTDEMRRSAAPSSYIWAGRSIVLPMTPSAAAFAIPRWVLTVVVFSFAVVDRGLTLTHRVQFSGLPLSIVDILAGLLCFAVLAIWIQKRQVAYYRQAVPIVVVTLIGALYGHVHGHASYFILQDLRVYFYPVLFFLAVAAVSDEPLTVRRLALVLLAGVALVAIFQLVISAWLYLHQQFLPALLDIEPGTTVRQGPLNQTDLYRDNYLGSQRILILFGVALAYLSRSRIPRWAPPLGLLSGTAMLLALERSVWVSSIVTIAANYLRPKVSGRFKKFAVLLVAVVCLVAAIALVPGVGHTVLARYSELINPTSTPAIAYRVTEMRNVLGQLPVVGLLVGVGLGATVSFVDPASGLPVHAALLHNQILYFVFKTGPVGLLAMLLLYWPARRAWLATNPLSAGLVTGVLGMLVLSLVGGGIADYIIAPVMVSAAMIASALAKRGEQTDQPATGTGTTGVASPLLEPTS